MEKSRKKEILENLCCKEIIFAFLCIIACVVLFFVRACFPVGTVIRTALGLVETNVGALAILVLLLSAPPARRRACGCMRRLCLRPSPWLESALRLLPVRQSMSSLR